MSIYVLTFIKLLCCHEGFENSVCSPWPKKFVHHWLREVANPEEHALPKWFTMPNVVSLGQNGTNIWEIYPKS